MFKDKISHLWEAEKFLNHFRDPFRPGPMVPAKNAGMSIVILPFQISKEAGSSASFSNVNYIQLIDGQC